MDRREQNGRRYVCKVLGTEILSLKSRVKTFLSVFRLCSAHFRYHLQYLLLHFSHSEPPEAYIDNEHDEKDATGCQFGIGGAGIQVLCIAPVLL